MYRSKEVSSESGRLSDQGSGTKLFTIGEQKAKVASKSHRRLSFVDEPERILDFTNVEALDS